MSPNQNPQRKPTILVIDDEEIVRLLFKSLLEEEGYDPLLAETGQEGIGMLRQHRPPLALVDKNLPDISGLDLIAEQKREHPNTEFIMITGYASLDSAIRAMEMGAFSYLTKPFSDMDIVMDRIRAALEVNTLRSETELLRERLSSLGDKPPAEVPAASPPAQSSLTSELRSTVRFLESLIEKRAIPPTAASWMRVADQLAEEVRRLKKLIQALGRTES